MQFTTIFIAAASVAMAAAAPNWKETKTSAAPAPTSSTSICGNNQVASCCNADTEDILLGLITGISCTIDASCTQGSVACCPTESNDTGLINVNGICLPVTVL